ncbi:uncharacterized protein LOC128647639 [Bombina bombina]|uniref:uncharacterized protein LOC128647639 n=1 Tax=Bombina bombina TaxID=8345 RepID=UPI00235A55F8|nr:uncharacterized protein LOC128647639 [Bombina bombina]
MKIKEHFQNTPQSVDTLDPLHKCRKPSTFEPHNCSASTKTYVRLVTQDMEQERTTKTWKHNLTSIEKTAIKTLQDDHSLIIRPADKGGAIVLMNYDDYREDILTQLADANTYSMLTKDPTTMYKKQIDGILQMGLQQGYLTDKLYDFCVTQYPRIPILYTTPKIHKTLHKPPGRPIVSAVQSLTQPVAQVIDILLQPTVKGVRSYIADTNDLIRKMRDVSVETGDILVTLDVNSLYTIIPHDKGMDAVRTHLTEGRLYEGPPVEYLLTLLEYCLSHNYFRFDTKFYLQIAGTAMGSNMAPSYANIFMFQFENDYLWNTDTSSIVFYVRYIDDVFLIWRGGQRTLLDWFNYLNNTETTVRFKISHNEKEIQFLDLNIYIQGHKLGSTLYHKPTDRNSILSANSCHPPTLLRGIIKSQMIRVIRNNSNHFAGVSQLQEMRDKFLQRGYKKRIVEDTLNEVLTLTQDNFIYKAAKAETESKLIMATTFAPNTTQAGKILRTHWLLIQSDTRLKFAERMTPMIAYRRGTNLRDILVRTDPKKSYIGATHKNIKGSYKCLGCTTCNGLISTKTFHHPQTNKVYTIQHSISCNTTHVIYLLYCPCSQFYVGKMSGTLRERMANYRRAIRVALKEGDSDQPVARHCAVKSHQVSTIRYILIDHIPPLDRGGDWNKTLLRREAEWMYRLGTVTPGGLISPPDYKALI